jgi:Na+-translocating ferredoxin:NAD+ oxidoreductase RnfD subunit
MDKVKHLMFNAAPLALLAAWLHFGHAGLMNVALFIIWALFVPSAILNTAEDSLKRRALVEPWPSMLMWALWLSGSCGS